MKTFEELNHDERMEITALFANWLNPYTDEVIKKVMQKADEIINNDMAMMLLRELEERDEKEHYEFTRSIYNLLTDYEYFSGHGVRLNCLTHAGSYRDVLYDMYIR